MPFPEYLASAPADEFFWWSAIPALLAAGAFVASFVFLHRKRLIEDMPTSALRSAAQGYVEVEGIARLMEGPPIISPLSGTRCVWWRYKVEKKQRQHGGGRSRTSWVTVDRGLSDDSFLLDDGTGKCVVDPAGASVIPAVTRRWYGRGPRPDVSFEAGRGFWRSIFCDYRYTEELIFAAREVYALGTFRTQAASESFDEQLDVKELLQKWKHDPKMMALFDVDKDGSVNMKEWEAARRMAIEQVRREHVARAVEQAADLHILARPRDKRPFILSGIPQAALVRRYTVQAMACIGGSTFAAGFALWTLHVRGIIA